VAELVWAYLRVSTRKEEQEESLEQQQRRAEAFAAQQHLPIKIFTEQASAKSITFRPVLTAVLRDMEALPARQRPKFLFVTALDRLARDIADSMYIGRMLRALKITLLVDGRGEVRLDTFAERAVFVGESLGGDAENEARSKRMRDSWERRRRAGLPTSNKVPYGIQLVGEKDVPIPESAAWVLKAFKWYAEGIGTYIIAKRFAEGAPVHTWLTTRVGEDGNRIPKTRVTRWESLRMMKLLRLKRYRGSIVDAALFDRVQARIDSIPKQSGRRKREYPLTGAMRCSGCGRRPHGHATGGSTTQKMADGTTKRYTKVNRVRYYACSACSYSLNAEIVEQKFFADVGQLVASEALLRRWVSAPRMGSNEARQLRSEAKKLEADLRDEVVQRKRDHLFDLALSASIKDDQFRRQADRLETEVHAKRNRLAEITAALSNDESTARTLERARSLLADFERLYGLASYEDKRQLVEAVADALGGLNVSKEGLQWIKQPSVAERETPAQRKGRPTSTSKNSKVRSSSSKAKR
jgi:DNA invertase Pin-like site-specific DNA recombinase